jgi:hypothetical protein
MKLLLWCILFAISWPLALVALIILPFAWLLALPFRLLGKAVHLVEAVFELVLLPITLPARMLRRV